jgi:serine/threonine protein kinase/WD40 repeat protein
MEALLDADAPSALRHRPAEPIADIDQFPMPPAKEQPRSPNSDPLAGSRLPGYRLERELGRGGMGIVYQAQDLRLPRTVAIKLLLGGEAADYTRFRREAEAVARLRHPDIVQIYEIGTSAGQPFLVFEYIAGGTLTDRLRAQPLPAMEAAALMVRLARAAAHAHVHQVVHRDLKPGNILLDEQGTPKIADFGVARLAGRDDATHTRTGQVIGTPGYMAPEQALGNGPVGPAADIYALGAIFYETLTGRPPFVGARSLDVLAQVVHNEPLAPSRLHRLVPRDAEVICLKCLAKRPGERYATAEDLAEDLERFLRGDPILARPLSPVIRLARRARQSPFITALILGLMIVTVAGISGVLLQWREAVTARNLYQASAEENRRDSAWLTLDRGLELAEQGRVDEGLHWMLKAAQEAPPDAANLQHVARVNLAGWSHRVHPLCWILPHPDQITAIGISPDGQTLVTGCRDTYARRWSLATGKMLGTPLGPHAGIVRSIAFPADGRSVLTGNEVAPDGTPAQHYAVHKWDLATGAALGQPAIQKDAFWRIAPGSPDGATVFTLPHYGTTLREFDLTSGQLLQEIVAKSDPMLFGPSPDGSTLWMVQRSNVDERPQLYSVDRDTKQLAPIAATDRNIRAWRHRRFNGRVALGWHQRGADRFDLVTGRSLGPPLTLADMLTDCLFTPDGRIIAATSASGIRLWETTTGRLVGNLDHHGGVAFLDISTDGRFLAGGGYYSPTHDGAGEPAVMVWALAQPLSRPAPQATSDGEARFVGRPGLYSSARFAPDGKRVAFLPRADTGRGPRLWDIATDQPRPIPAVSSNRPGQMAFTPQGELLAGGATTPAVTIEANGRTRHRYNRGNGGTLAVAASADGQWVAASGLSRVVKVWPANQPNATPARVELADAICELTFAPDGRTLAAATVASRRECCEVTFLRMPTLEPVGAPLRFRTGGSAAVRFHPTQPVAVVFARSECYLVDTTTAATIQTIAHARGCTTATFSDSGTFLATGTADGTVRLFQGKTGQPAPGLPPFQAPGRSRVTAIVLREDSQQLTVGYADGATRCWDVPSGRLLGPPLVQRAGVLALRHRADGSLLVAGADGTIRHWPAPAPLIEALKSFGQRLPLRTALQW